MKQLIFLFMLYCFTTMQSQNVSDLIIIDDQQAIDACVDGLIYVVAEPSIRGQDATIAQYALDGTVLQQAVFPNDNPSFTTVQAREVSANKGLVFATAQTFSNVRGNLNRSESLFKIPSDLVVTSDTDRLVAYNSEFSGLYNNDQFIYMLYSASSDDATLSINNVDGTGTSIIPNPGNGSFIRTWLLKIDVNDVTNIIQIMPIGDTTNNTFVNYNTVDDRTDLQQNIIELKNGNIVIEYIDEPVDGNNIYLAIINPLDLSTVKSFGPFNQDICIADFNDGYVLGYYKDEMLEFFDSDFIIRHMTSPQDLPTAPYKMLQFGEFLKVAGAAGIRPGSETTRMSYFGERLIESHKRGGLPFDVDFKNYFESFMTSQTTTINVANYQGPATSLAGYDIEETPRGSSRIIIYTTDESGPEDTIGITGTNPDFMNVYQNTKLNPSDNNVLVSGTFNETWVTLAPGTIIPEDETRVPNSWLTDIQIPPGFKLNFGNFAFMESDPFSEDGYNRFFTVRITPNINSSYNDGNLETLDVMRVWVTHNSFSSVLIDTDGDGVLDMTEIANNTSINNPCDNPNVAPNTTNATWRNADCDNDGELNGTEADCAIANGCNTPSDINCRAYYNANQNCATLSVDNFDMSHFSVYPNPTNGIVNIQSSVAIDAIEIYALTGKKIGRYNAVSQIDLSSVASGLYMLRIFSGSGDSAIIKIVKK